MTLVTLPSSHVELLHRRVHQDLTAEARDVLGHRLPHLAGAVAGVVELADQRLDLVALVAEEGGLGRREERQALDPLGGPVGADLGHRHAPHLLGVGAEEVVEQALAEAVGHPLLEGVLASLGLHHGPGVGEHAARQLDRAELLDHVGPAQRVVEELLVPVDARHPRALEELLAHDLVPEVVDLLDLGEEAVAAQVEAVLAAGAVADLGLGDAADLVLGLEDDHRQALLGQQVAGGQAGRAGAQDQGRLLFHAGVGGLDRGSGLRGRGAVGGLGGLGVARHVLVLAHRLGECLGVKDAAHSDPAGAAVEGRHGLVAREAGVQPPWPGPTGRIGAARAGSKGRPSRRCCS
ncbi:MAG: hypothetical protein WKF40_02430 [Thermoleophilaceae bacterium]